MANPLTPLERGQIQLGQATAWTIFDAWGNPLYEAGTVFKDAAALELILMDAYIEQASDDRLASPVTPANPAPAKTPPTSNGTATKSEKPLQTGQTQDLNKDQNKEANSIDLDSVKWQVGEVFYLQVHDNPGMRYTVRLIGYVKHKSILVTAPTVDGKGAIIRDGQTFIVRSFPGKRAYAFTASALKSVYSPHAYLHLSYPKQVACTAIRQSTRANVKIIASVSVGMPEQTAAASLADMSLGGTSGILRKEIGQKGDRGVIKFKVTTAGEEIYLILPVIVRSITATENTEEFRYGFEFVDVPSQSKIFLSSFVYQTLAETE